MNCTLIKETLAHDLVNKGAIDVGTNTITNKILFKQLNDVHAKNLQKKYKLDDKQYPFLIEKNKAVPNDEFLNKIDRLANPELAHEEKFQAGYEGAVTKEVQIAYDNTPELSKIGTPKQYENYLNTLFPGSKIKDIVAHVSKTKGIEKFKINHSGNGNFINSTVHGEGVYFAPADNVDYWSMELGFIDEMTGEYTKDRNVYYALLNSKTPQKTNKNYVDAKDIKPDTDVVVNYSTANPEFIDQYIIQDPDIIHIMGSKKDIEKFKSYVDTAPQLSKAQDLVKQIMSRDIEASYKKFFSKMSNSGKAYLNYLENPTEDDLNTTQAKIDRMQEVFDATVIIDNDLNASGALLAANHPITVKNGKPTIAINPNQLFSDTVFHEFGHLYIDLLGGLQDPVVAGAVEQLKNSTLWSEVASTYPELSGDALAKEVLATALGIKGNDIYKNEQQETVWQQLKRNLLEAISKLFGGRFGVDKVEMLATEMLTGKVRLTGTEKFNSLVDQMRVNRMKNPTQAEIKARFENDNKRFKLKKDTHEYIDTEDNNKAFSTSASTVAKSYTYGKKDYKRKESRDLDYTEAYKLTKDNYQVLLNDSRLPVALDRALQAFFNGELEKRLTISNNNSENYWYGFYTKQLSNDLIKDDLQQQIIAGLDAINEKAAQLEQENQIPAIMGTYVHEALENYINNREEFPGNIIDKDHKLMSTIKNIIDQGEAKGSMFFTEQMLFSDVAKIPGTADLIEITKDAKFKIYDFKTTQYLNNFDGSRKSDQQLYIKTGYMNQLIVYSTILEEYGIAPAEDHMNIITIHVGKDNFDVENPQDSPIMINEVINKNINPSDSKFTSNFKESQRKILARFTSPEKMREMKIETQEQKLDNLVQKVQRGLIDYKRLTDGYTGKFTAEADSVKDNYELFKLEEKIKELTGVNNGLVIYKYIDNMRTALSNVYERSVSGDEGLSPEYIKNVEYLLQASNFVSDVKTFIENSAEDFMIDKKDKVEMMQLLDETVSAVNKVKDMHDEQSKRLAIKTLADNSNYMKGLYMEQAEVQARKKGYKTKDEIDAFIEKQIVDKKTEIDQLEYQYWEKMIYNGYTDIRQLEYYLADPGMNKSQFVQVVKNILDKVDKDIRIDLDNSIPDIVNWHTNLKFKTTGDPKKVWKEFIEEVHYKDLDGNEVSYPGAYVIPEQISIYRKRYLEYKYKIDYLNREINKAFSKQQKKKAEGIIEKKEALLKQKEEELGKLAKEPEATKLRDNPAFLALSEDKKEALRFIHKKLEESDERLYAAPSKKLVTTVKGAKIYALPKMRKSMIEAVHDTNGTWDRFKSGLQDYLRPPADEDEENTSQEEQNDYESFRTKNTDILGNPSYDVPVFYRNELDDPTLQSFDIPTLLAMNEETTIAFKEHKMVEADLFMITSALKNSDALKTDAVESKNVVDKIQDKLPKALKSEANLTLKAVEASINNRFYKRNYQGTYSKWHYRAIKAGEALGGATSAILLAGNFRSATMTGVQGSIYRFVEGFAGENFNMSDVKAGSSKAWGDIKDILSDTQQQFPSSKTNLLIRRFGLETQYKALTNKFIQNNIMTKNLDQGTVFAITTIAETMVTANLMYTLLNNIKVMNAEGDYINKEGKKVDKKDAMSLDEAYEVVDGKLKLNEHVAFTEKNLTERYSMVHVGEKTVAATEISRYIRSIYADLYGQYNQDMKSVAEMHVAGRLAFSMRKWITRGAHRRWRGLFSITGYSFDELRDKDNVHDLAHKRFYSQDQQKFQEGYYTTGIRYIYSIYREMQEKKLSFVAAKKNINGTMSSHELANKKRLFFEMLIMVSTAAAAFAFQGVAKAMDDDEDDRSQDKIYYMLYLLERIKMESATFINPLELKRNLENPAASLSVIGKLERLLVNLFGFGYDAEGEFNFNINDRYERGLRKGDLKVTKNILEFMPGYKSGSQFMGILGFDSNENIKDTYEFSVR